jgi:hypothetical protein
MPLKASPVYMEDRLVITELCQHIKYNKRSEPDRDNLGSSPRATCDRGVFPKININIPENSTCNSMGAHIRLVPSGTPMKMQYYPKQKCSFRIGAAVKDNSPRNPLDIVWVYEGKLERLDIIRKSLQVLRIHSTFA